MFAANASCDAPAMKPFWFLLWAAGTGLVASWTFAPAPAPQLSVEPGKETAFETNEDIHVESRAGLKKQAFTALELPWGARCRGEGHEKFIAGLKEYYYHRQNQSERYPETFGKAGADYIAKQWSSGDDKRIDRLTQEAYAKGYLRPADFSGLSRKLIDAVIREERVTGKACES
jgi:hypothetical protein